MANVTDSFTRADSATSLGNADSGQTWAAQTGTWGISSNQAYIASQAGQNTAAIDSGESDGTVAATVAVWSGDDGILFRGIDDSNYLFVTANSTILILYERVAGGFAELTRYSSLSFASGDILSAVLSGTSVTIKQNGTTLITFTTSRFQTSTKYGMRSFGSALPKWDDFSFTGAGAASTPDMSFLHRIDRHRALRGRRVARSSRTRRQV
jgi:hypothetical protein